MITLIVTFASLVILFFAVSLSGKSLHYVPPSLRSCDVSVYVPNPSYVCSCLKQLESCLLLISIFAFPSVCLFPPAGQLPVCLPGYLSVFLLARLPVLFFLPDCVFASAVCIYICISVCPCVCLSIHMSVCLSICMALSACPLCCTSYVPVRNSVCYCCWQFSLEPLTQRTPYSLHFLGSSAVNLQSVKSIALRVKG